jgi:formylglycine-generating enzyme required for sulfatase activity
MKNIKGFIGMVPIIACAIIPVVARAQSNAHAYADASSLARQIAQLKSDTANLVASEQTRLEALSPQQRLSAPPAVWRVPGALVEFKECAGCPRMVVIPAGEFTMGAPTSEQGAGSRGGTSAPRYYRGSFRRQQIGSLL